MAFTAVLAAAVPLACGDTDEEADKQEESCALVDEKGCEDGLVCEEVAGGDPACFPPVIVRGSVIDTATGAAIAGARVVARDANGAAVSSVAVSAPDGSYELAVPAPRDEDGKPTSETLYTLRADAAGYLTFPRAPREALPVDVSKASGEPLVVSSAATAIGLIKLPDAGATGSVSGTVEGEDPGGTLIVVGGQTAVADKDGAFTVFNVPAGSQEVRAYRLGVALTSASVDVAAGDGVEGVTLGPSAEKTATVSGSVAIVNAPGGLKTSVILVVEDTFDERAVRGEAPPGLRVGEVTGAWSLDGVPPGKYVVLAAFENDNLVRDPDTSIGGTDVQRITVAGAAVTVPGFKVTESLRVLSPGATGAEAVSGKPTLSWVDDSSEDEYRVTVYDAFGIEVWKTQGDFDPGGSKPVEVAYAGPPLVDGMTYQFRVVSIKDGTPISATEDLRGVFYVK
jgi:hypothetical protein